MLEDRIAPRGAPTPALADAPSDPPARRRSIGDLLARYGVLASFALTIVVFCVLRPESFATVENLQAVLADAAPLVIVAVGVTVILVMDDFDLSVVGQIGVLAAIVVTLMSSRGFPIGLAVLCCLLVAVAIGLFNGFFVAKAGASSFIFTLAIGQLLGGAELSISGGTTVFENIPEGFRSIASTEILGFNSSVFVAIAVVVVGFVLLEHTQPGRYMYAIGGNKEAARLSGIPVVRLKVVGFVIVALSCAIAAILLSSQSNAYTYNVGVSFFLPVFAAVFLGAAMLRPGQFHVTGTLVGALYLQVIATGLTMLNLSTAGILIVQGSILAIAVLISVAERRWA